MDQVSFDLRPSASVRGPNGQPPYQSSTDNVLVAAWHRRGVVSACAVLSLVAAGAVLAIVPPRYRSEAILQLNLAERETGQIEGGGPAIQLDPNALIQGELKIIRSRTIASRAVTSLHLDDPVRASPPSITHALLASPLSALWAARDIIAHKIAGEPAAYQADAQAVEPAAVRRTVAENAVISGLSAETDNRSYILTIGFVAEDPARAAAITTAVAEEYIRRRMEANFDASGKTVELLDREIAETNKLLNNAEDTVQDYRAQTGLLEVGATENLNQQRLRALASQLTAASLARAEAQSRLERVEALVRSGSVPSTSDLQGSPMVQSLLERRATAWANVNAVLSRLGQHHPAQVQAQDTLDGINAALAAELRSAVAIIRKDLAARQQAEESLKAQMTSLQFDMIDGKRPESELRSRQLTAQSVRDRLAALTRNRDQALAFQDLHPVAASLIVPAEVPSGPVFPKPLVIVPAFLAGGLTLGIILGTFLERRDQGLRSGSEVELLAGTRCLGMLPELGRKRQALCPADWQANSVGALQFAEAIRSVGASVRLYDANSNCRVVMIVSSEQSEGKSTLCLALAQSLVAAGKRVLVVDGAPLRHTGPSSATFSQAPLAQASGEPRQALTVLQRNSARWLANDVFSGGNFGSLLEQAKRHFDVILLEGPPVLLVADALVLGRMADTVIHVTRWGRTRTQAVLAGLHQFREASVPVDGIVLTRVDLKRHAILKLVDQCTYFSQEKRFYEKLQSTGKLSTSNQSWDA